jgi:Integrase core domain/GAG-pre-integrase domain
VPEQQGTGGPSTETGNLVKFGNVLALSSVFNSSIIVDSGATDHMCSSSQLINDIQTRLDCPTVTVANGVQIPTMGTGSVNLFSWKIDVLIVPDLKTNLLSVSKCVKEWNCDIIFTLDKVIFQDRVTKKMSGEGKLRDGLYTLELNKVAFIAANKVASLWHSRMGHPSDRVLHALDLSLTHNSNNCDTCHFAKQHRLPFPEHCNKSVNLFDLVHSDVWGYAPVDSREGFKYFITFIEDKSRATWVYLLKSKREVCDYFRGFCNMVKNLFNTTVKILRTDNGTEYTNHNFQELLSNLGITH